MPFAAFVIVVTAVLVAELLVVFGRRLVVFLLVAKSMSALCLMATVVDDFVFLLVATAGDDLSLEAVVLVGGVFYDAEHTVRVDHANKINVNEFLNLGNNN